MDKVLLRQEPQEHFLTGSLCEDSSTGRWLIYAGEDAEVEQEETDLEDDLSPLFPAEKNTFSALRLDDRSGHIRLYDIEGNLTQPTTQQAQQCLSEAYKAFDSMLRAAGRIIATHSMQEISLKAARMLNGGSPKATAEALALTMCALKASGPHADEIETMAYTIIHKRATFQLAHYTAAVYDIDAFKVISALRDISQSGNTSPLLAVLKDAPLKLTPFLTISAKDDKRAAATAAPEETHYETIDFGWFSVDALDRHKGIYRISGSHIPIKAKAFKYLQYLYQNRHRYVSVEELAKITGRLPLTVRHSVTGLRDQITATLANTEHATENVIVTMRGKGYRFRQPGETWHVISIKESVEIKPVSTRNFSHFSIERYSRKTNQYMFKGANVTLNPGAYKLLQYLFKHADRFVPATEITQALFSTNKHPQAAYSVTLTHLRRAIEDYLKKRNLPANPIIVTWRGQGIRFLKEGVTWEKPKTIAPVVDKYSEKADFGHFILDIAPHAKQLPAKFANTNIALSKKEYEILIYLHKDMGKPLSLKSLRRALFPDVKRTSNIVSVMLGNLEKKMTLALGSDMTRSIFAWRHSTQVCLAKPDSPLPMLAVAPRKKKSFRTSLIEQYGYIKIAIDTSRKTGRYRLEETTEAIPPNVYKLVKFLHKKGFVSIREIKKIFETPTQYYQARNALKKALTTAFEQRNDLENFPLVEIQGQGICLFDVPKERRKLPKPVMAKRIFRRATELSRAQMQEMPIQAKDETPILFFHSAYGLGYDAGLGEESYDGQTFSGRLFIPHDRVTDIAEGNQKPIFIGEASLKSGGYGAVDALRFQMRIKNAYYELHSALCEQRPPLIPDIKTASRIFQKSRVPDDMCAILHYLSTHRLQVKDGSFGLHAGVMDVMKREMKIFYPTITFDAISTHLQNLAQINKPLPDELIWPFENLNVFDSNLSRLNTFSRNRAHRSDSGMHEGQRIVSDGKNSKHDLSVFFARYADSPALTVGIADKNNQNASAPVTRPATLFPL